MTPTLEQQVMEMYNAYVDRPVIASTLHIPLERVDLIIFNQGH